LPEPRDDDVKPIAEYKARYAYNELNKPLVVLDAGFYIDSLNGFPKAFTNFALETVGLEGILRLVEGKERNCEFRHCLAYLDGNLNQPRCFTSSVRGIIAEGPRGTMQPHLWSKLGLIFIPQDSDKTLGEMSPEEYASFSKNHPQETSCQKQFGEWYSKRV